MDTKIHRHDEVVAKISPSASTLKAKSMPGKSVNPVNRMGPFFNTAEDMDKTVKQSAKLPAKFPLSLKFGFFPAKRMNTATRKGRIIAHTGR